jgi:putative nucleotidyltransferase with HDIG domain
VSGPPEPSRNKASLLRELKAFPPVAAQLMQIVSAPEVSLRDISELIRSDAALAGKVLRLANSPLLGCRREIASILHAVSMLGLERVRSLVLTVAVKELMSPSLEEPVLRRCWRHNLACAFLAEEFSGFSLLEKDACYTAGLLHDVGRLMLLANSPGEYTRALEMAEQDDRDILECERAVFGIDHCEAGRWLVEQWMFPLEFREIVGAHHRNGAPERMDKPGLVRLCCRAADALGFQVAGAGPLALCDTGLPAAALSRAGAEEQLTLAVACKINAIECSFGC